MPWCSGEAASRDVQTVPGAPCAAYACGMQRRTSLSVPCCGHARGRRRRAKSIDVFDTTVAMYKAYRRRRRALRLCPAQGPSPSPRVHRSLMKTDAGDGFESLSECHLRGNRSGSYFFFFVFLSSFFLCGKRSTSAGFELPEREEGWTERAGRALWRPPRPTAGRACAMCMEQAHATALACGWLTRAAAVGAL